MAGNNYADTAVTIELTLAGCEASAPIIFNEFRKTRNICLKKQGKKSQ